jgi:hypothetical protein
MEISVEFCNKDLVKKLGCKWLKNKDKNYNWICPFDISSTNLKELIKLQDQGKIGFKTGKKISTNRYTYKKSEGEVLFVVNDGGPTWHYEICLNEKQIYEQINTVFRLPKNEDGDLFIAEEEEPSKAEQELNKKIKELNDIKLIKYNEMLKRQEQERLQFEESYNEELTHLNNCKFRDYDQDIRSFN